MTAKVVWCILPFHPIFEACNFTCDFYKWLSQPHIKQALCIALGFQSEDGATVRIAWKPAYGHSPG